MIRNLFISHIEVRSEEDPDVAPYINSKTIEIIRADQSQFSDGGRSGGNGFPESSGDLSLVKKHLGSLMKPFIACLNQLGLLCCPNPLNLLPMVVNEAEAYVFLTRIKRA